ncbi:hypothetical protein AMATHDRAFT_142104, partial [Amanita thiersii Skay4041]
GIYICLFIESLFIMLKKRSSVSTASTFLIVTILMFLVASAHVALSLYRLLQGYVIRRETLGPYLYYFDQSRLENLMCNILLCVMVWMGDGLVIYRCYIIWNCNYYIILLPIVLLVGSLLVNCAVFYFMRNPRSMSFHVIKRLLDSVFPLAFIQNILTTGLIAFKIWYTHRESNASGAHLAGSRVNLITIMRILVESAMLYTIQLFVCLILYPMKHNALFVVEAAAVPSIGIVFDLIAVRTHLACSDSLWSQSTGLHGVTDWLEGPFHSEHADSFPLSQRRSRRLSKSDGVVKSGSEPNLALQFDLESLKIPEMRHNHDSMGTSA